MLSPLYANFIPILSVLCPIHRHEYILCQFLCRFYSEGNMTLKRIKWEWIWNEFRVLFQFYSKQKYSFQYSGINFFLSPLYANFIPILSVLCQVHSQYRHEYILCQFLCRFYSEGMKRNKNGMKTFMPNSFIIFFNISIPFLCQYENIYAIFIPIIYSKNAKR